MKSTIALFIILLVTINASAQSEKTKMDFRSLSWLEGKWMRLNIKKPGRTSFESWRKTGDYELTGLGVTLQAKDTVFIEKLKITIEENEIHYVADVPENSNPVHFIIKLISAKQFTCENPKHDYPKMISYQLEGNTLRAQTSGDGKVQEFVFEKQH